MPEPRPSRPGRRVHPAARRRMELDERTLARRNAQRLALGLEPLTAVTARELDQIMIGELLHRTRVRPPVDDEEVPF